MIHPLWKTVWRFLKKLGIKLPYDPATPLLVIYLEETITEEDICTSIFIEALFILARTWNKRLVPNRKGSTSRLYIVTLICRVHHEKCWAGRSTSWNQDCQKKYQ